MTSPLAVSNLALAHIAIGRPIAALTEATPAARVMKQFYSQARDEVLRDVEWPFARALASLAQVATNPSPDWGYSYRYPDECLFVRDVYSGTRRPTTRPGPNLIFPTDDLATSPWSSGGGMATATNAYARFAGSWFTRIANTANGNWAQLRVLSASGTYRMRFRLHIDGTAAGTVEFGLFDATAGVVRGDFTSVIVSDGSMTFASSIGRIVWSVLLAGGENVYDVCVEITGVVGGNNHTIFSAVRNVASPTSFLVSRFEFKLGTSIGRVPYVVGQDDSGRLIYASEIPLQIEYTVAVDEENWPPDFAAAVSFLLAWYAAPMLTGGDPQKLGERARSAYQEAIARAQLTGENEQDEDLPVANMALLHLGVGGPEDGAGRQLAAMRSVRQFYTQVRDELFREFNWPFARKFASLGAVAGPSPRASTDFAYSYRYPLDCLAARALRTGPRRALAGGSTATAFIGGAISTLPPDGVPFIVGQDGVGRLIFTDAAPVAATGDWAAFPELEYTVLIDQALWPPDFLAAVAARLAWQAAPFVVTGDASKLRERARAEYELAIGRAWRAHLTEQEPDAEPESTFITSRY